MNMTNDSDLNHFIFQVSNHQQVSPVSYTLARRTFFDNWKQQALRGIRKTDIADASTGRTDPEQAS